MLAIADSELGLKQHRNTTFALTYAGPVFMYAGGGFANDGFTLGSKCADVHAEFHPKTRSNV